MTKVVRIEHTTRRLHRAWAAAAVALTGAAASIGLVAGGETAWLRLVLAAIVVEQTWAVCVHRASLATPVALATLALMLVPIDARVDRTLVSAVGAVLVVAGAECAHVSRRLVTVAPVQRTPRDVAAVARLAMLTSFGVAVTTALGVIDAGATGVLVTGLGIVAVAFTCLVRRPDDGAAAG